jgi:AcrR family transcriptional regulator
MARPQAEKEDRLPREKLLDVAERLFSSRGFAAVTLRDIGRELSLSHASFYYHFPGGKEELFIEVMKRSILRHGEALSQRLALTGHDIRAALRSIAEWLSAQPPLDLIRMAQSDMPVLKPEDARRIMDLMHGQVLLRVQIALQEADEAGEIHCANPALVGGAFVGMVESFHSIPEFALRNSRLEMAHEMIDILLRGMEYRGFKKQESWEEI